MLDSVDGFDIEIEDADGRFRDQAEDELLGSSIVPYLDAKKKGQGCCQRCCPCCSCCPCCPCCPCTSKTGVNDQMRNVLQNSEIGRVNESGYDEGFDTVARPVNRSQTVDVETGYIKKIKHVEKPGVKMSMDKIRRSSLVSKQLPKPAELIEKSNKKAERQKQKQKKEANDMEEINKMLLQEVTKSPFRYSFKRAADKEVKMVSGITGTDVTSHVLSSLVKQESITQVVSSGRRQSIVVGRGRTSGRTLPSVSSNKPTGRRMSVTYRNVGNNKTNVRDAFIGLSQEQKNPKGYKFLENMVAISNDVKRELEKDWAYTVNYMKMLEKHFQGDSALITRRKTTERWMVILYTTSDDNVDTFTNFRCLLVRLILQYHLVAYEERDVALTKYPYKEELKRRLEGEAYTLPSVFAHGVSIGGCRMVYGMHKLKKVTEIFGRFMLPEDMYAEWMQNRQLRKTPLNLNVPLSDFPTLAKVAQGGRANVSRSELRNIEAGKQVVVKARKKWAERCKERYTDYNLFHFALIRTTLQLAFSRLNMIYESHLGTRTRRPTLLQRLSIASRRGSS